MDSSGRFAKGLAEFFLSPHVAKRLAELNRDAYVIGDGKQVCLNDFVLIPDSAGSSRKGTWGVVVMLDEEGLGLRFKERVGKVTHEFFAWEELMSARCTAAPRQRKRKSVVPPRLET